MTIQWGADWQRAEKIGAMRNPNSPFSDGYDLDAERKILAEAGILDSEDEDLIRHPLWNRFTEYELRLGAINKAMSVHNYRSGADPLVNDREANRIMDIGRLESEADDVLKVNTRHAYRLFMGRAKPPVQQEVGKEVFPIVGGRKAAASLLALWNLSAKDNPYADWALIKFIDKVEKLKGKLVSGTEKLQKQMAEMAHRGFTIHMMSSIKPQTLELGFRSPYGYEIAYLLAEFDYAVRTILTMGMKALMDSERADLTIAVLQREARAIFYEVLRAQRVLTNEHLAALTRADWLPTADEQAALRIKGCVALLGELPKDVLNLTRVPKHHKKLRQLSDDDRRLLDAYSLTEVEAEPIGAEEGLVEYGAEKLL